MATPTNCLFGLKTAIFSKKVPDDILAEWHCEGGRFFWTQYSDASAAFPDYYFTTPRHTNFIHPGVEVLSTDWILDSVDANRLLPTRFYLVQGIPPPTFNPFSFLCSFVKGIFVSGDEKKKGVKRALESDETELEARKKRIEKAVNAVQEALTKLEEAAVKPQDLIKKEKSGKGEQDVAKGEGDVMGEIVVKESNSEDGEWHFDQMDDGEALSLDNDVSSDRIGECARDRGVMEHGHQSNRDSPLTSPIPRYSRLQAPGSREESEQLYDLMSMAPFEQKSKGSSPSPEIPEAVQSTQEVATFASRPTTPGQGNESPQDPHDQVVPETPPRRTHFTPQVPIKETPQPTLPTPTSVTSKDLNPPKAPPESISMASFASRSPRTSATPARQVKRLLEPLYTNEELYKPNFIFSTCPPRALPPKVQTHGTVWDVDILWANEETIYLTKSK